MEPQREVPKPRKEHGDRSERASLVPAEQMRALRAFVRKHSLPLHVAVKEAE